MPLILSSVGPTKWIYLTPNGRPLPKIPCGESLLITLLARNTIDIFALIALLRS